MSDLGTLMRMRPSYGAFHNQRNIVHRGEIVSFRPKIRHEHFSTDSFGFRKSSLGGKSMSVKEALDSPRYGLVLGSSHIFGLGTRGDENTLPSLLGERFGFPFANVSLPEGNSRNLFSLLNGYLMRNANAPAIVLHFSGGDFTSFCYGGYADSVFGSPNLKQVGNTSKAAAEYPPAASTFPALLAFTTLWTRSIIQLCRARHVPVVLGHDTTFFEKGSANDVEAACKLGEPLNPLQKRWFPVHHTYFPQFSERRGQIAGNQKVRLVGTGIAEQLSFIDEFHYDEAGTRLIADAVCAQIENLL